MVLMRLNVHYHGAVPAARGFARAVNQAKTDSYISIGRLWHREIRPQHFLPSAEAKYQYRPRTGQPGNPPERGYSYWQSYHGRKRKYQGHVNPLVYSGDSQRATEQVVYTATSKGVRVSMEGGNLTYKPANSDIDMAAELTASHPDDEMQLARHFDRNMENRLVGVPLRETKKLL